MDGWGRGGLGCLRTDTYVSCNRNAWEMGRGGGGQYFPQLFAPSESIGPPPPSKM